MFECKTPSELRCQTIALLYTLLLVSRGMPQSLKPSQDFLPLQNLHLYFEAFRVEERPLGAFQPLEHAWLASALQESRLYSHDISIRPQMMESWDRYLRQALLINCDRSELVSSREI